MIPAPSSERPARAVDQPQPYAVAKIAGIVMAQAYRRQFGFNAISLMPTNLYGPPQPRMLYVGVSGVKCIPRSTDSDQRDRCRPPPRRQEIVVPATSLFDLLNGPRLSHVLPALIRKFHEAKQAGDRRVVVWGSGTPRREFLHVDDLAAAAVFLMRRFDSGEIINVGSGSDISIQALAELVGEVVGYRGGIVFDRSKPDGTPRKLLDVTRLAALGWEAKIPLRAGVEQTYDWFLAERAGSPQPGSPQLDAPQPGSQPLTRAAG